MLTGQTFLSLSLSPKSCLEEDCWLASFSLHELGLGRGPDEDTSPDKDPAPEAFSSGAGGPWPGPWWPLGPSCGPNLTWSYTGPV